MDRHARWLRARIAGSIARQCLATALVAAPLIAVILRRTTDIEPLSVALAAVLGAQMIAVARLVHGASTGAMSRTFVERYVEEPYALVPAPSSSTNPALVDTPPHEAADELVGFSWFATIFDPFRTPTPVYDLYRRGDAVVASISRASGAIALHSPLTGGRILVTDGWPMPPHEGLVVNLASSTDVEAVVAAHLDVLSDRPDLDHRTCADHTIVSEALHREHATYEALGPWLGALFHARNDRRPSMRMRAAVGAEELIELADRRSSVFRATASPQLSLSRRVAP